MSEREVFRVGDDEAVWLDSDGGITIKAVTQDGDQLNFLRHRHGASRRH